MKADIWMPLYVGDYLKDTMSLFAEEHGIYFLLMLECWNCGKVHNDINRIKAIVKSDNTQFITGILERYFTFEDEAWTHKRVSEEKTKAESRSDAARANINKRWHSDTGVHTGVSIPYIPNTIRNGYSSPSPSPSPSESNINTKTHTRAIRPYGVDFETFWNAYPQDRKGSKREAFDAWTKLESKKVLPGLSVLLDVIKRQVASKHFRSGDGNDYIPHVSTWLNKWRWEDQIIEKLSILEQIRRDREKEKTENEF